MLGVLNAIAVVFLVLWSFRGPQTSFGDSVELRLVPVERAERTARIADLPTPPARPSVQEVRPEFSSYDFTPPAWEVQPDGTVRVLK